MKSMNRQAASAVTTTSRGRALGVGVLLNCLARSGVASMKSVKRRIRGSVNP